ncbi:hypothetical protein [Gimesia panareensis]|uniref:Uncharacterized protein n=1 Tax=Gimesia panareensis TaxID=2527978 RepID=A0A517Q053_9PLAN|nr:hypothetical protein [Gimesia panareensis]QDT25005.1 hypothetical protein Enr10x_02990 [Gimesia panareensis]QDU47999.1 hypothetical protein Pan110_03110 [Gimesia panareensis]QDV15676.1 hypothetical protein Pan153_02920 [Gimesia panareensis]
MNGLRLLGVLCLSGLLLTTQTGCKGLGNKFFQIDSNSRSPFLGLEFYTRKDKQPAQIQNVSQDQPVELEPAILQTKAEEPSRFSRLPKWLNPMSKKAEQGERIPLPRTDLEENEVILEEPAEKSDSGELGSSLENF